MLVINVSNYIFDYLGRVLGYFPTSAIQNSSSFSVLYVVTKKGAIQSNKSPTLWPWSWVSGVA